MEYQPSPLLPIIADLAKNNKNLTPALQDAIATFINYEATTPQYSVSSFNLEMMDKLTTK